MDRLNYLGMVLAVMVMVSAFLVVYSAHESRKRVNDLQLLRAEKDQLEIEWSRLLLEHSTLKAYSRVEAEAVNQLHMLEPDMATIRVFEKPEQ